MSSRWMATQLFDLNIEVGSQSMFDVDFSDLGVLDLPCTRVCWRDRIVDALLKSRSMATAERPVPQTASATKSDSHQRNLAELEARHAIAEEGGGAERREREKKAGKLSARERVEFLLDEGKFEETDTFVTHRATNLSVSSNGQVCHASRDGFWHGGAACSRGWVHHRIWAGA